MSDAEHERIQDLLTRHGTIERTVEEIAGGVKTTTVTTQPQLVDTLRTHVREMVARLSNNDPVRAWDPVFRGLFAHSGEIQVQIDDIPEGVVVTETTSNPEVVRLIRDHARAVSRFAAEGRAAAAPPWAGVRR